MCDRHSHGHDGADSASADERSAHAGEASDSGAGGSRPDASRRARGPVARGVESLILFYRRRISSAKPVPTCRFEPTCSAYGLESVRRLGAVRGSWLTLMRIMRCAPWHPGGWDPVPRTFPGLGSWWRRMHG